jgi:predicted secreted protein
MRRTAIWAVGLAVALPGCGETTFENPTGPVEVSKGDSFVLEFTVNAGVGIDWDLDERPPAGAAVGHVDTTLADQEDEDGGSAHKRFKFKASRTGTAELGFTEDYRGDARRRRSIRVQVTD